eukprot:g61740.t1
MNDFLSNLNAIELVVNGAGVSACPRYGAVCPAALRVARTVGSEHCTNFLFALYQLLKYDNDEAVQASLRLQGRWESYRRCKYFQLKAQDSEC